ncbi:hypothetical protein ACFX2K_009659 [Malus domestica]
MSLQHNYWFEKMMGFGDDGMDSITLGNDSVFVWRSKTHREREWRRNGKKLERKDGKVGLGKLEWDYYNNCFK